MKNTTILLALPLFCAALILRPQEVIADVPSTIPIQGRLTDAAGLPLDGDHTLHFALYDAADVEIFSETQVVAIDDGDFTAYLGTIQDLDVSLIEGELSLGIAIDDDVEMVPRIPFGSVPFAMHSPDIPHGMVSYFDLETCPIGWSALAEAQGRAIVGIPEDGTLQGTVGNPLEDVENRPHSHSADPGAVNTSSDGSHDHQTLVQGGLNTSSVSVAHTHSIPALAGSTDDHVHNHQYFEGNDGALDETFDSAGGLLPLGPFDANGAPWVGTTIVHGTSGDLYTDNDTHDHVVTTTATNTGGMSANTNHSHPFSVPALTTDMDGSHTHSVNVTSTSSSNASTSDVIPYVQFVVCRKD